MSEDEDRTTIGRIVAPPAAPPARAPRTANRPKHIATHKDGAISVEVSSKHRVVDAFTAAVFADHRSTGLGSEYPLVQRATADAERMLLVLVGSSPETIGGY